MRLKRVYSHTEFIFDENGVRPQHVYDDVLVDTLFRRVVKKHEFWQSILYIVYAVAMDILANVTHISRFADFLCGVITTTSILKIANVIKKERKKYQEIPYQ